MLILEQGQIRLLEYSKDGRTLYFTTTLQNAVQCYSLNNSQLLDPLCLHPSPPTVLAVSPNNNLIISASESPPLVYLQNLQLGTQPQAIYPQSSSAAVVVAAFHPERANVFMLGFRDGTISAHDATRIMREKRVGNTTTGRGRNPTRATQSGEIGVLKAVHTATTGNTAKSDGMALPSTQGSVITGASFIPGQRTRAVTVGTDGRCRIVDFEQGGKILRTWHVRGPATCLSILSCRSASVSTIRSSRHATIEKTTEDRRGMIAIGRQDGKVLLFDFLGLQISEQFIDRNGGRIIDVSWRNGVGPKNVIEENQQLHVVTTIQTGPIDEIDGRASPSRRIIMRTSPEEPGISRPVVWEVGSMVAPTIIAGDGKLEIKETITVEEFGTVHHLPVEGGALRALPPVQTTNYMDLFSPVKQSTTIPSTKPIPEKRSPLKRPRPRLASDTFTESSVGPAPRSPNLQLNSSTGHHDDSIDDIQSNPLELPSYNAARCPTGDRECASDPLPGAPLSTRKPRLTSTRKHRRISNVRMPGAFPVSQTTLLSIGSSSSSSSSGKILADLRRVGGGGTRRRSGLGLLAPYISAKAGKSGSSARERQNLGRNSARETHEISSFDGDSSSNEMQKDQRTTSRHRRHGDENEEDIWLSDDSVPETRRKAQVARDCLPRNPVLSPPDLLPQSRRRSPIKQQQRRGPEKENLSPGSAQSPSGPVHVEDFFPRRSSLTSSPQRRHNRVLQETNGNVDKSPTRKIREHNVITKNITTNEVENWLEVANDKSPVRARDHCRCNGVCCGELRREVEMMRKEMAALRKEMRMMRGG